VLIQGWKLVTIINTPLGPLVHLSLFEVGQFYNQINTKRTTYNQRNWQKPPAEDNCIIPWLLNETPLRKELIK